MLSPFHILNRAKLFRQFSLVVDKIDFARRQLPADERSKSVVLDGLYKKADSLVMKMKRLGGY